MSILIKNVLFNDKTIDIYIEGKEIKQIGAGLSFPADKILDGSRKAVIPGFVNAHTHAAMTCSAALAMICRLCRGLSKRSGRMRRK